MLCSVVKWANIPPLHFYTLTKMHVISIERHYFLCTVCFFHKHTQNSVIKSSFHVDKVLYVFINTHCHSPSFLYTHLFIYIYIYIHIYLYKKLLLQCTFHMFYNCAHRCIGLSGNEFRNRSVGVQYQIPNVEVILALCKAVFWAKLQKN
jgi:hypothetical protein